jgi:hypothetical protein
MRWRHLTHFPIKDFERRCHARGLFGQIIWRPDFETYSAFVFAADVPEPRYQPFLDWHYQDCSQLTVDQGFSLVASQLAGLIVENRLLLAMRSFDRLIKSFNSIGPFAELLALLDPATLGKKVEDETWVVVDKQNADPTVVESVLDSPLGHSSLGILGFADASFHRNRPVHELTNEEATRITKEIVALIAICYDETVPVFLLGPKDSESLLESQILDFGKDRGKEKHR